jgi:class 3 adenylate cyclase
MALAMRVEVARHTDPSGQPLAVRIGIDTGPVEAGVIGTSKFSYDLWGDTVNTASRMESHGIAGCIQVTDRTYQRLRDRYRFQRREPIQVRGMGEMVTYLLLGRNR